MKLRTLAFVVPIAFFVGCANNGSHEDVFTKKDAYPTMYTQQPKAILVLPPVNKSTAADAGDFYITTLAEPLTQKGFYVLPMTLTSAILKQEGIVDGAQLRNTDISVFKNYFGADAVLFSTINEWKTSYVVFSGSVTVSVAFELVSTQTGEVIWNYDDTIVVNTTGDRNSNGGLLGALIATAINTATQDYVPIARNINQQASGMLPAGPYHSQHNLDQSTPGFKSHQ